MFEGGTCRPVCPKFGSVFAPICPPLWGKPEQPATTESSARRRHCWVQLSARQRIVPVLTFCNPRAVYQIYRFSSGSTRTRCLLRRPHLRKLQAMRPFLLFLSTLALQTASVIYRLLSRTTSSPGWLRRRGLFLRYVRCGVFLNSVLCNSSVLRSASAKIRAARAFRRLPSAWQRRFLRSRPVRGRERERVMRPREPQQLHSTSAAESAYQFPPRIWWRRAYDWRRRAFRV